MPHTLQQFERLTTIHNKLATGGRYTLEELRRACISNGQIPSERTLYSDIKRLRDVYDAPIPERDRSKRPYYYRQGERFSLYAVLNSDDAALANEVASLLKQVSHLPQFWGLEDVFLKFEQRAGIVGSAEKSVIQFEQNLDYVGLKWLQTLYDSIRANHQVLIHYQDFTVSKPTQYIVSPYLLREYNNRWFLMGSADGWQSGRPFPLDRILNVVSLPNLRRRPDDTDWNREFNDVVGVTRIPENSVETFVLRVQLPRAHYVRTKPLHHSQEVLQKTQTHLDFQYQLRWNNELIAKILELGSDAELLEPAHRREEIVEKVRKMAEDYKVYV